MKLLLTFTLALASLAGAFDIPKGSHNLAQLDEAKKKAVKAKQPIAFLITEKKGVATWVACPGAVSVSASKAVLSFSKSVVVDVSETAGLPDLVKNAYRTGGASIPIVILVDPGLEKIYGRFDHPAMKTQKYGTIFKEAKADISKAKSEGTFAMGPAPEVVKVKDGKIEIWKSAAGSEIKAKLIGVEEDTTYIFETAEGKTIRATAKQLDKASVAKARKAAGLK